MYRNLGPLKVPGDQGLQARLGYMRCARSMWNVKNGPYVFYREERGNGGTAHRTAPERSAWPSYHEPVRG